MTKELNKTITVLGLAYSLNKCVLCTAKIVNKVFQIIDFM